MKNNLLRMARAAMVMLLAVLGSTGAWAEDGVITVGSGGRSSIANIILGVNTSSSRVVQETDMAEPQ